MLSNLLPQDLQLFPLPITNNLLWNVENWKLTETLFVYFILLIAVLLWVGKLTWRLNGHILVSVSCVREVVLSILSSNCSGIANPFDIEESTVEELQNTMNVNLMSHFWTIKALLPHLKKSKIFNGLCFSF